MNEIAYALIVLAGALISILVSSLIMETSYSKYWYLPTIIYTTCVVTVLIIVCILGRI